MKKGIIAYFNLSSELRKKSIHLLYLVFLVLIFAFIPGHQNVHKEIEIDQHHKLAEEFQNKSVVNALLVLHMVEDNQTLYQEIKFKTTESERLAKEIEQNIIILRKSLTSEEGQVTESASDSLFKMIHDYKLALDQLSHFNISASLDSLLGNDKLIRDESGKLHTNYDYYFAKSDRTNSWYNLDLISSYCKRALALTIDAVISQSLEEYGDHQLQQTALHSSQNWTRLLESKSISSYLDPMVHAQKPASRGLANTQLKINANHLEQLRIGEFLHYDLDWNSNEKLLISIERAGQKEYFSMSQKGAFRYYALEAGSYGR